MRITIKNAHKLRNLMVGSDWTLRAMLYRVRCELKDFWKKYLDGFATSALYCGYH